MATIPERVAALEECTKEMANVLMGTPKSSLSGGGRSENGIVHAVSRIEQQLGNGGIKTKLQIKDRVALWCAAITAVSGIIVALVK